MMLNVNTAVNDCVNSLEAYNHTSYDKYSPGHLDVVVDRCYAHIRDNLEVWFYWDAVDTNGTQDPLTEFAAEISGSLPGSLYGSISLSGVFSKLELWFKSLSLIFSAGFVFTEQNLLNTSSIGLRNTNDAGTALSYCIVEPFFEWIKQCTLDDFTGSHGQYTGTASLKEII